MERRGWSEIPVGSGRWVSNLSSSVVQRRDDGYYHTGSHGYMKDKGPFDTPEQAIVRSSDPNRVFEMPNPSLAESAGWRYSSGDAYPTWYNSFKSVYVTLLSDGYYYNDQGLVRGPFDSFADVVRKWQQKHGVRIFTTHCEGMDITR